MERLTWPNEKTPAEWRQPGQGVWQFRSGSSAVVGEPKPAEPTPPAQEPKPSEPRIVAHDPPTKFRLPPEKPAPVKPTPTPQGQRSPTDEYQVDDMPPAARRLFDALPQERKNLFKKYHYGYGLGWKRSGKLLGWLADPKLPREELEVRGRLLLISDERYQELYKTVLATAVDNAAEDALWKAAAKGLGIPAIKYVELCKDLITLPGEFKKLATSYEKASDADRVLERYVASYGKSEMEIKKEILITEEAIEAWKHQYERAQAEFQRAKAEAPRAGEPLASDPQLRQRQREASQKMLQADQTMRKMAKEIHDLELDSQALDLRLKTINGQWKSWSGKLEK